MHSVTGLSFNSTLVQLKVKTREVIEAYRIMFQFYLSSIKSQQFGNIMPELS